MGDSTNPELQRLLATLNGYASTPHPIDTGKDTNTLLDYRSSPNVTPPSMFIPGLGQLPPEPTRPIIPKSQTPSVITSQPESHHPSPRPPTLSTTTPTPSRLQSPAPNIPDASTITTWPAALKHITKHLATSDKVTTRIQHLIFEQHKHERQWHEGREALLAMQKSRVGTSAQVSALLRSLGGNDLSLSTPTDPKANQIELDAYDTKVYKSLLSMTADFDRQLRTLGIPFFAIKHELVILEEGKERADAVRGRVDKGELRELQKRMLQHLEDLFGD